MREEGGCGHWTASPIRVEAAQYLVCVRNRSEQWAAMDFEHGVAFLIARIKRTKPSPHAARNQRFPVAYLETAELFRRLQLNPEELTWQQLPGNPAPAQVAENMLPYQAQADAAQGRGASLTQAIAEAKHKLAESLGIASEKIEITIRL